MKNSFFQDGKGYEDENGNPVLAPWMVPPDDMTDINARAAVAHHASNRTQQSFPGEGTYPNVCHLYFSYCGLGLMKNSPFR